MTDDLSSKEETFAALLHAEFGKPDTSWADLSEPAKKRWRKKAARLTASLSLARGQTPGAPNG